MGTLLAGKLLSAGVTAALLLMFPVSFAVLYIANRFELLAQAAEDCFTVLTWAGVLLLGQVLWNFYGARGHTRETPLHVSAPFSQKPRVIWIVLDELSYVQTYERRFPGLKLTGFDLLASQGIVFTNVVSAATMTDRALPALMTGTAVEAIRASADGQLLWVSSRSDAPWREFQPNETIFFDALHEGYRTGVAGWYNPYCRILPEVLNACVWEPHRNTLPGGFISDVSLSRDLTAPLFSALQFVRRAGGQGADPRLMDDHIAEYRVLERAALNLLNDSSLTSLLLHLPAPHPEGIFDRHRMEFTDSGNASYLDNLTLADRFLQQLQRRADWDVSAVLVIGDHSWRTEQLWRNLPGWTREDEQASGGEYDGRPGYVLKLSGQHVGLRIEDSFDALRTRSLLDALLLRQLRSPEDAVRWVQKINSKTN